MIDLTRNVRFFYPQTQVPGTRYRVPGTRYPPSPPPQVPGPFPLPRVPGTRYIRYKIRGEANGRDGIMKQDFRYKLGQSQS